MLHNKTNLSKVKISHATCRNEWNRHFFRILRNLTKGWCLCCLKHRCRNLSGYPNIYFHESIFLLKGNSTIWLKYWNDDFFGNKSVCILYAYHPKCKINFYSKYLWERWQRNGRRKVLIIPKKKVGIQKEPLRVK